MLKELVDYLVNLGTSQKKPYYLEHASRRRQLFLVHADGSMSEFVKDQNPRSHKVHSLESLILAVRDEHMTSQALAKIFVNQAGVELVCSDDDRTDRVTLPFTCDPRLQILRALESRDTGMGHKEFVTFLRRKLASILIDADLISRLRRIDSAATTAGKSEVGRGRDRGTREFVKELAGADEVPETVLFSLPVFTIPDFPRTYKVCCDLDIEFVGDVPMFVLAPKPTEIDSAIAAAINDITELLTESVSPIPVFRGVV